jgi:site-specific recombinase XerD
VTPQPLIQQFKTYLSVQRQRSNHTISNYIRDIQQFFDLTTCNSHKINTISTQIVQNYLVELNNRQLSQASINRKLSALNQFWDYLVSQNICKNNPWKTVRRPRIRQKIPTYLEEQTVLELLNNYPTDTPEHIRNKAILELLFASGIRVNECIQLDMNDIYLDQHQCRVRGKGDKERLPLFGQRCAQWLQHYIKEIRPQWQKKQCWAVFLSKNGTRITERTVQRIVKDANQYHNSPITITPHACRHTCASMLLVNGAGIRDIQEFLGHTSITTTQRYAHLPTKKLQKRFLDAISE